MRVLVALATAGVICLSPSFVHTAAALSCVAVTNASPEAIVSGTEELPTGRAFFDQYDIAIVGTVVGITTDERSGSPTYGATRTTFRVSSAFGTTTIDESFVVNSADPGWLAGYAFEAGRSYFVPIVVQNPDGFRNFSMTCDPIAVVADVATASEGLIALATTHDLAWATPGAVTTAEPSPDSDEGLPTIPIATGVGVAAIAAAGLATLAARRRSTLAAGVAEASGPPR